MSNYALDTPFNHKIYVPAAHVQSYAPATQPKHSTEVDQTHRRLTWLFHRPQDHSFFPVRAESARIDKKK